MSDFGDTTNLEKTSLEAHVDLCAMRYGQLDQRLTGIEYKFDQIQKEITEGQKSLKTTIITTAATIISSVIGLVIVMVMR